jgi:single-strand DNA-binding protein
VRVVSRLKQGRWTGPEGQPRSKVSIVAEHVEFKPQAKKDGDGKGDGAAEAEGKAGEKAAEEQAQDEVELKEAANF